MDGAGTEERDEGDDDWVVAELNRDAVARSTQVARRVGSVVTVAGAVTFLLWLWVAARQQLEANRTGFLFPGIDDGEVDLRERLDLLASTVSLLATAAVTVATGVLLRLAADYAGTQVGLDVTAHWRHRAEAEAEDDLDDG